jgi:hypothetical protein
MSSNTNIRISFGDREYHVDTGNRQLAEFHEIAAGKSQSWNGVSALSEIRDLARWISTFDMAIINLLLENLERTEDCYVQLSEPGEFTRYERLWLVITHQH